MKRHDNTGYNKDGNGQEENETEYLYFYRYGCGIRICMQIQRPFVETSKQRVYMPPPD